MRSVPLFRLVVLVVGVALLSAEQPQPRGRGTRNNANKNPNNRNQKKKKKFKNFEVQSQPESKSFHIFQDHQKPPKKTASGSEGDSGSDEQDDVYEQLGSAINSNKQLQSHMMQTLQNSKAQPKPASGTDEETGKNQKSAGGVAGQSTHNSPSSGEGTPGGQGEQGHPKHADFYDFDFYRDQCDEPKDSFGFKCSEYVFAGEHTCAEMIRDLEYEDCHCACQDAYTEKPKTKSHECTATCAIKGHTCDQWLEVYAQQRQKAPNKLMMDKKGGGKSEQKAQPQLTCARMERVWGCDCSGCSGCDDDADADFGVGDDSQKGDRVPPPHLSEFGRAEKRRENAASSLGPSDPLGPAAAVALLSWMMLRC